jgi:hypothetical protein
LVKASLLFHIPADPLITQHARSNKAVLPGASADPRGASNPGIRTRMAGMSACI